MESSQSGGWKPGKGCVRKGFWMQAADFWVHQWQRSCTQGTLGTPTLIALRDHLQRPPLLVLTYFWDVSIAELEGK